MFNNFNSIFPHVLNLTCLKSSFPRRSVGLIGNGHGCILCNGDPSCLHLPFQRWLCSDVGIVPPMMDAVRRDWSILSIVEFLIEFAVSILPTPCPMQVQPWCFSAKYRLSPQTWSCVLYAALHLDSTHINRVLLHSLSLPWWSFSWFFYYLPRLLIYCHPKRSQACIPNDSYLTRRYSHRICSSLRVRYPSYILSCFRPNFQWNRKIIALLLSNKQIIFKLIATKFTQDCRGSGHSGTPGC